MYQTYGRDYAPFYDELYEDAESADRAGKFLATLARQTTVPSLLEFGVGTGRVALPVARLGVPVTGVDVSAEMLEVMERKSAEEDVPLESVQGDIRDVDLGREFGVVAIICGTLSMMLTCEQQLEVLHNAVRHLAPGGRVVIEGHNAALITAMYAGKTHESAITPYPDRDAALLTTGTLNVFNGVWAVSSVWMRAGEPVHVTQEQARLIPLTELDLMARLAGLELDARQADWSGAPTTGADAYPVSVYRAPT